MAQPGSKIRPEVSGRSLSQGFIDIGAKLRYRLGTKGYRSYASRHEIFGILAEEMDELLDELRINTRAGHKNFRKELMDVAVAALFGYISMDGYIPYVPKKKLKKR